MAKKELRGRGLADLLGENSFDIESDDGESVREISLSEIKPNDEQPRKVFNKESLDELTSSIAEHGVFQPIIVKSTLKGYKIVAGERRYRASLQAGLETIPAIVRDYNKEKVLQISLLENLQREDLTPIEEAQAYQVLVDELGLTQTQLSEKVGKSRSHITNMLGLLALPSDIVEMVNNKKLSMAHARTLSKLESEDEIRKLADKIINEKMSVRDLESETKKTEKKNPSKKVENSDDFAFESKFLTEKFDTPVKVSNNQIVIKTKDKQSLIDIIEHFKKI